MTLKQYNKKRDFSKTLEPVGKRSSKYKNIFVVQKHAASHLHYDFRLELNGILLSWAIPKGPCLDPSIKRLAIHVEDHPVEYGNFEGIIPEGEYGGGTVMLWDKGKWACEEEDAENSYKKGRLHFTLKGKKLNGQFSLVRIRQDNKTWLLVKGKDEYAKPLAKYDVLEEEPISVLTGLTMDEIAQQAKQTWTKQGLKKYKKNETAIKVSKEEAMDIKKLKSSKTTSKNVDTPFLLTNPQKILYPGDNITKMDLANYYNEIKKWILPYIINRPISLLRCPENVEECFYQKHINDFPSSSLYSIATGKDKSDEYLYIKDIDGLMTFVQMGVLEIHPWGSRVDSFDYPDIMTFDLDPAPGIEWKRVVETAKLIKQELAAFKLKSFVKSTGGKGLHVVIPIKPEYQWNEVKNFAHVFVDYLVKLRPDQYASNMSKAKRVGKIFIDYLRNQKGATAIAPYSTRAKAGAPVATPLHWDELSNNIKENSYTIFNVVKRLKQLEEDPWRDFFKIKQSLHLDKL